jgi:hypothetical protein
MALQTYALNRRMKPNFALCTLLTPYPGTDIHQICEDLGCLEQHPDSTDVQCSYMTDDSALALPDKAALVNLQKLFYVALALRMPEVLLRFLVRLPLTQVYRLLYGMGMVWGLSRINKGTLLSMVTLSVFHFFRYNRANEIELPMSWDRSQTSVVKRPTRGIEV